jgi:hypothetical protein
LSSIHPFWPTDRRAVPRRRTDGRPPPRTAPARSPSYPPALVRPATQRRLSVRPGRSWCTASLSSRPTATGPVPPSSVGFCGTIVPPRGPRRRARRAPGPGRHVPFKGVRKQHHRWPGRCRAGHGATRDTRAGQRSRRRPGCGWLSPGCRGGCAATSWPG